MKTLKESVEKLHKLIINNKILDAWEEFYADNISMQENGEAARVGKKINIENEINNLKKIKQVKAEVINVAINESKGIVMSEWRHEITYLDDHVFLLEEISIQHWKNNQIVYERFYYDRIKPL